jgi:hypothetical protein
VTANTIYLATIWIIPVIVAITFHEAAHDFVAPHLALPAPFPNSARRNAYIPCACHSSILSLGNSATRLRIAPASEIGFWFSRRRNLRIRTCEPQDRRVFDAA